MKIVPQDFVRRSKKLDVPPTAIHFAVRQNKLGDLKRALESGADIDAQIYHDINHNIHPHLRERSGDTALHIAAKFGHTTMFLLLLKHGADPNIKNSSKQTVFDILENKKHIQDSGDFLARIKYLSIRIDLKKEEIKQSKDNNEIVAKERVIEILKKIREEISETQFADVRIQSTWRGQQERQLNASATVIQTAVRGRQVRQKVARFAIVRKLDAAIDKCYQNIFKEGIGDPGRPLTDEQQRQKKLIKRYQHMKQGMEKV